MVQVWAPLADAILDWTGLFAGGVNSRKSLETQDLNVACAQGYTAAKKIIYSWYRSNNIAPTVIPKAYYILGNIVLQGKQHVILHRNSSMEDNKNQTGQQGSPLLIFSQLQDSPPGPIFLV